MLFKTKSSESFYNDFANTDKVFLLESIVNCTYKVKMCFVRQSSISVGYLLFGSNLNTKF